ncbi:MAG: peptidase [Nitrospinota bacterium]|nr:peptidase [Nitrospinota bacterium]
MSVIEIFRAGRHTAQTGAEVDITSQQLAAAAQAYDPATSEAPLVVGHPAADAPAYGWVKSLKVAAGSLLAELSQLDPAFAELVRTGRYKKISASFYTPDSPHNPRPGAWYLRHVGFLGAQPPAVKGLRAVSFAGAPDGVLEFTTQDTAWARLAGLMKGLKVLLAEKFGQAAAEKALPVVDLSALEIKPATAPDPSALQTPDGPSAQVVAPTTQPAPGLAQFQERLALVESGSFVEGLVREGKILPRHGAFLSSFLASLPADGVVEFAENGSSIRKGLTPAFRDFLKSLPPIVDFSERSAAPLDFAGSHIELGKQIAGAAFNGK